MIENQTPAEEYREIAGRFTDLVEGVPNDQTRKRQSPVAEWKARDVVRHLVEWFPGFLASGAGITLPQGPDVDDDPVADHGRAPTARPARRVRSGIVEPKDGGFGGHRGRRTAILMSLRMCPPLLAVSRDPARGLVIVVVSVS